MGSKFCECRCDMGLSRKLNKYTEDNTRLWKEIATRFLPPGLPGFFQFICGSRYIAKLPRSVKYFLLLVFFAALNLTILLSTYQSRTETVTDPVLSNHTIPVAASTSAVRRSEGEYGPFQNYPHLANTSELSLEHCGKQFRWPAWESGVLTKTQPFIEKRCDLLWKGDEEEVNSVSSQISKWSNQMTDESFLSDYLSNCAAVQAEFTNFYVSEIERSFPIAYLMNVHTNVQQITRFLKSVYRSTNVYCIHVDLKSPSVLLKSLQKLGKCLPNVFLARKRYDVQYSTIDQVDALRSCYKDLLEVDVQWKYAINLCGRELPLRTNREIVQLLMNMEGANVIDPGVSLYDPKVAYLVRRRVIHQVQRFPVVHLTTFPLRSLPGGITPYKNNTFIAATRDFIKYLFEDDLANDFYLFLRDVHNPDEEYFTTLNHLPEAPGGLHQLEAKGLMSELPQVSSSFWFTRVSDLISRVPIIGKSLRSDCELRYQRHGVCIISIHDLPAIKGRFMEGDQQVMFFNKYFDDFDHVVMDCAEWNLIERNKQEFLADCKLLESS